MWPQRALMMARSWGRSWPINATLSQSDHALVRMRRFNCSFTPTEPMPASTQDLPELVIKVEHDIQKHPDRFAEPVAWWNHTLQA